MRRRQRQQQQQQLVLMQPPCGQLHANTHALTRTHVAAGRNRSVSHTRSRLDIQLSPPNTLSAVLQRRPGSDARRPLLSHRRRRCLRTRASPVRVFPHLITLRAKHSGAVYCNRSCLRRADGGRAGGLTAGGRCLLPRNCIHRFSPNLVCR